MKVIGPVTVLIVAAVPCRVQADDGFDSAVSRGLAYLAKEGPGFASENGRCITCHHGPLTVWAQRDAGQLGFEIEKSGLDQYETRILAKYVRGKKGPDKNKWRHTQAAFFALAQPDSWDPAGQADLVSAMVYEFKAAQQGNGSWIAANQFTGQRRPKGEAHLLQTMWNLLAISRIEKQDESLTKVREAGLAFVRKAKSPQAMDTRSVRLMIEQRFGTPESAKVQLDALLEDQNEDGSWGWIVGEKGDTWATGIVLYALDFLGDSVPPEKIRSAQSWLVKLQKEDGSWFAPTRLNAEKHDSEISSYFATSWSVLGLARTLR